VFRHQSIRKAPLDCNNVLSEEGFWQLFMKINVTRFYVHVYPAVMKCSGSSMLQREPWLGGVFALQRGTARYWGGGCLGLSDYKRLHTSVDTLHRAASLYTPPGLTG